MEDWDIEETLSNLEAKLKKVQDILEFHGLDKIPLRYRKAYPKPGESPFFEPRISYKREKPLECYPLDRANPVTEINLPIDAPELDAAKKRMAAYLLEKDKITQPYFLLDDENGCIVGETDSEDEAKKWRTEGPTRPVTYTTETGDEVTLAIPVRDFYRKFRRVLKPQSAVASSASSSKQDTCQQNHPASCQTADEHPSHNSPPSQT